MATETIDADPAIDADAVDSDGAADVAPETKVEVKRRSPAGRAPAAARRKPAPGRRPAGTAEQQIRRLPRLGALVLAAAAAVLIGATGFFGYHYFAGGETVDTAATRGEVVRIANDYAVKLSSFDYRDLNKNREVIAAMSTEDFGKKYDEMVKALTEIVANGKGVATATVTNSAVESLSDGKATVILFVNQKARNVVAPDGKSQPYRMVVKLVRADGRWLVDDVQTV